MLPPFLFPLASARSFRYSLQSVKSFDGRRRRCNLRFAIESGSSLRLSGSGWPVNLLLGTNLMTFFERARSVQAYVRKVRVNDIN
jgi:hypothetical protein